MEFEAVVDDSDHPSQLPIRYRFLNDVRDIKRFYCGINVNCPHGTNEGESKKRDLKIQRFG